MRSSTILINLKDAVSLVNAIVCMICPNGVQPASDPHRAGVATIVRKSDTGSSEHGPCKNSA